MGAKDIEAIYTYADQDIINDYVAGTGKGINPAFATLTPNFKNPANGAEAGESATLALASNVAGELEITVSNFKTANGVGIVKVITGDGIGNTERVVKEDGLITIEGLTSGELAIVRMETQEGRQIASETETIL